MHNVLVAPTFFMPGLAGMPFARYQTTAGLQRNLRDTPDSM